jgi:hypothetical protein
VLLDKIGGESGPCGKVSLVDGVRPS